MDYEIKLRLSKIKKRTALLIKKVLICNEYGKPEIGCECDGYGDDKNHDESNH